MPSYLLSCRCGRALPVEVGQAGEQIQCPCGATLDVPPLRQLRQLPVAAAAHEAAPSRWTAGHGAIAACLVLAGLAMLAAGWSYWSEPVEQQFDPAQRTRYVESQVQGLTPAQGWWAWVDVFRPLRQTGFTPMDFGLSAAEKRELARAQFFQKMMLVAAGVFVAAAVGIVVLRKTVRPR